MSSIGFPDGQRITQWLGAPIVEAAGLVIGNVLHSDGPFSLASWASVIVAIKPTGGNVTVRVRQQISGGPPGLELDETFVIPAGATAFEAVVLFGDAVTLELTGSAPGVSVDYALYPSNSTTNAQVLTQATINVQHNDVLVAAEATLDFEDASGFAWGVVDDAPNTRVKITPPAIVAPAMVLLEEQTLAVDAASVVFNGGGGGISQAYKHLVLRGRYRNNPSANSWLLCRLNGITAVRYGGQLRLSHAVTQSAANFGDSAWYFCLGWLLGWFEATIFDYTAVANPTYASRGGNTFDTATSPPPTGADGFEEFVSAGYMTDAFVGPTTSLTLFTASGAAIKAGSHFELYGVV